MPSIHFADPELEQELKKLPQGNNEPETMAEHRFIAECLKIGLRLEDLKELELKDVAKIMLCFIDKPKDNVRKATQKDIDRFLS